MERHPLLCGLLNRAYQQLKNQIDSENKKRQEEEERLSAMHSKQAAERERRATEAEKERQKRLKADMVAANNDMLRLKVCNMIY